jgi:hypothetical protein
MPVDEIQQINKQIKSLRKKLNLMALVTCALLVMILGLLGFLQFGNLKSLNLPSVEQAAGNVSQLEVKPVIKKDYQVSISSFYNNTAISEVGFQIDLKKQSISTKNTKNCFTPTVPSIKNGCGFVVRPYAAGITPEGTYLHQILFKAKLRATDKIAVDIKDSEKNEITRSLGVIEGKSPVLGIKIPNTLKQNEQILVRLWPQTDGEVSIEEIFIENFTYAKLQPAKLSLPEVTAESSKGKKLNVYLDSDKNGKLDLNIDKLWNCADGFAGIKQVTIEDPKNITLSRDENCIEVSKWPESWRTDSAENAIQPYNWLAVVESENGKKESYPFEVTSDVKEYNLK